MTHALLVTKKTAQYILCNVWFHKISIPTPWMVIGNSKGVEVSKAKIL